MLTLAIDHFYKGCSLTVETQGGIRAEELIALEPGSLTTTLSTVLVPSIQKLCEEVGHSIGEISHIVTTVGPSSFTGIRISLSALQGLVLATQAKVLSATRLELLAYYVFCTTDLLETTVNLDNQKGGAFSQVFKKGERGLPEPLSDVTIIEGCPSITADSIPLAMTLLEFSKQFPQSAWKGVEALAPFYGHTPTFKKSL